jgi:ubiquinone/menaquinone biosynthesis C-methylase UbiE
MFDNEVQKYYQFSDNELARRYIKEHNFLSIEYCNAALEHRYKLYPFIHDFVNFKLWSGKKVLEIGCGQGADLYEFARHGAEVYGCDMTRKHCQISREFLNCLGKTAHIVQADARSLPYSSNSFDLVYSFGVLLLIKELDAAINEIHRVLKPGGSVIVMFYNRLSLHYYLKTLYYYGIVCDLEKFLGPRHLVDWFTDGYGYPRTYHQTAETLTAKFKRFEIDKIVVRNFTPDQLPLFNVEKYPASFWNWMSSRVGFYLLLQAHK